MPQDDGDSLKAEMAAQLRADWERARERRTTESASSAPPEPVTVPQPPPAPKRGFFGRLRG